MANTVYRSQLIEQVNAPVSYPDVLGLYMGLTRFVGETNTSFLQRIYRSTNAIKDTSVQGLIDSISLNLNLSIDKAISVTAPAGGTLFFLPGVMILNGTNYPLFTLANDTYLEWSNLSYIVDIINNVAGWTAALTVSDRSTLTVSKQSNVSSVVTEIVKLNGLLYTVENKGLIESSLLFSASPPDYTVDGDTITFSSIPNTTLKITYQYITNPFVVVSSEVNLVSLSEPLLIAQATNADNVLGYQLREALQNIMLVDRSYWAV